jgi:hypothetical protein
MEACKKVILYHAYIATERPLQAVAATKKQKEINA